MQQQQIGRLMIQANFGRKPLSSPALFLAHHYRLMVAVLTGALILSHLLITRAPALLLLAAMIYTTYVAIRLHMPLRLEFPFYTPRIQFWRAQAGIAGVTALLFLIGTYSSVGTLWVLYLAALLLISRYCDHQTTYMAVALEVAVLAAAARL